MDHDDHDDSQVPIQPYGISDFDLDDVFSDGDDLDMSRGFSSDMIREDIGKLADAHIPEEEEEEDIDDNRDAFEDTNTSVSTLDMNGDGQITPTSSHSQEDSELSSQFIQISLSPSSDDVKKEDVEKSLENMTEITLPISPSSEDSYPAVIIDDSQPPLHKVTLSAESNSSARELDEGNTPTHSRDSSDTPHNSHISAASVPSLSPTIFMTKSASTSSISTPEPDTPPPVPKLHRPARSLGPSALERFRSKTRPSFLPPKSKQEDNKHMKDWETMMKQSRAAADKRRKALQERRLLREKRIEESQHQWEKHIVPDWIAVTKNPHLRQLWWGGIPTKLRATMWEHAVGNSLALSKDSYRSCLVRAKRALSANTFPAATMTLIEEDMATTLPSLHIFRYEIGPMYQDLKDILCAWVVARSDEGLTYTYGASKIAAMLLINMPNQQAFIVMRNLLERHCMRSFYGGDAAKADVEAYYRIFDTLLADAMPKIYFNFKQHQISPSSYLRDWIMPLFLDHLPFEACARLWDVLLLEGDSFLYRAALAILAVLEPRLFFPEKKELLELLRGENKAAKAIARRDGQPLDGGKYEIYGVDEETLWEKINSMDDWWKESTWNRLIQRELPDL